MRILLSAVAAALLVGAAIAAVPAPTELEIGSRAPKTDMQLRDVSGSDVTLAGVNGRNGLLVIFSCNTCPYVIKWEDRYRALASKCQDAGVGMIAINSNEAQRDGVDSFEAMQKHAKEKKYTFPYVVDPNSELADAFGANRTPHIYLFDANLQLVYRGAIDDNYETAEKVKNHYLMDAIDALVSGQEIAQKTTKSIGCTIKRVR